MTKTEALREALKRWNFEDHEIACILRLCKEHGLMFVPQFHVDWEDGTRWQIDGDIEPLEVE